MNIRYPIYEGVYRILTLQIVCNKHPSGALHRLRYVLALRIRILPHRFGYSVVKNRKAVPVPPAERHETVSRGGAGRRSFAGR